MSAGAREEILARIRNGLRDVAPGEQPADVPVAREYRRAGERAGAGLVALLAERVGDYRAEVIVTGPGELVYVLRDAAVEMNLERVAVPPGLAEEWWPQGVEIIEDHGLSAADLDAVDAAVTGCAVAIAQTGTLVLDGQGASGRRGLTLVPDRHICIVLAEQIVELVPEAIAALGPAARAGAPLTFVSGPSASSDIELIRVEGVHGPRHLRVIIVAEPV